MPVIALRQSLIVVNRCGARPRKVREVDAHENFAALILQPLPSVNDENFTSLSFVIAVWARGELISSERTCDDMPRRKKNDDE